MTAAEQYAAMVDAVNAQRARLHGEQRSDDPWTGERVQRFRYDPRRRLDANLEVIASYVQREDVLIDVGGGASRISLPLALRCREVINVDASPAMLAAFEELAAQAGIRNARAVKSDWLGAGHPGGCDARGQRDLLRARHRALRAETGGCRPPAGDRPGLERAATQPE